MAGKPVKKLTRLARSQAQPLVIRQHRSGFALLVHVHRQCIRGMAEQVAAADDAALLEKLLWTSKDEADCETWRSAKIKAWEAGEKIKEKYPERAQLASTRVEIGAPSSRRIYGDNSGAP